MAEKRFYWIKLKTDFFNQDTIDFILQQENGCKYIVLYQMLCLKTANNNGELNTKIGEMIVPYNIEKIQRDTKYFDIDTIIVALELFKKLGLIYEEEDRTLKISSFEELVGSETSSAKRVREYRLKKALQCNKNVTQEIEYRDRDKSIEKDIDIEKEQQINVGAPTGNQEQDIYSYVESNFCRTLAPKEFEKINEWLLLFSEDIIKYAIDLSVLNGKKIFSYVEGILKNWQGSNFTSLEEIKENEKHKKDKVIENIPSWYNQEQQEDLMSEEELKEFEKMLGGNKNEM